MSLTSVLSATPNLSTTPKLNELFYLDPKKEASTNKAKETLLKIAAIVICIAAFAIAATALAFSFLSTAGAAVPIVLTLSSIGAVPLSWLAAKIWNLSAPYANLANIEYTVERIEQKILLEQASLPPDTRQEQTLQLLGRFGITPSEDTLKQLSNSLPRKDLPSAALFVPLLARLEYWIGKTATHHLATVTLLESAKSMDSADKRAQAYEQIFQNHQANTLRAALNAAIMLEIIDHPFSTGPSRLNQLGTAQIKPALACVLDSTFIQENTYLTLHQKNTKPISFNDMQSITDQFVNNYVQYINSKEKDLSQPLPFVEQLNQIRDLLFRPVQLEQKQPLETAQLEQT